CDGKEAGADRRSLFRVDEPQLVALGRCQRWQAFDDEQPALILRAPQRSGDSPRDSIGCRAHDRDAGGSKDALVARRRAGQSFFENLLFFRQLVGLVAVEGELALGLSLLLLQAVREGSRLTIEVIDALEHLFLDLDNTFPVIGGLLFRAGL